jgi:hypothetical protein
MSSFVAVNLDMVRRQNKAHPWSRRVDLKQTQPESLYFCCDMGTHSTQMLTFLKTHGCSTGVVARWVFSGGPQRLALYRGTKHREKSMGMFDYVRCETALPDARAFESDEFQTKSLYRAMDRFTVTAGGRLVHHKTRETVAEYKQDAGGNPSLRWEIVPLGDVDIEFHGDLHFGDVDADGQSADYVARFTNGQLDWIKPASDLPDIQRSWSGAGD